MLEDGAEFIAGCAGFIRSGKVSTQLEITSGARRAVGKPILGRSPHLVPLQWIWNLHVNTFGSQPFCILPWLVERRAIRVLSASST